MRTEEDRARTTHLIEQRLGVAAGDVQVLGRELVAESGGVVTIRNRDQRPEFLQGAAGEFAALERSELALQLAGHLIDQGFVPGDEHGRAGRVFGLCDQVRGGVAGRGGLVATTITSLGPAIESISTSPKTRRLASATNRLPGPTILSTRGTPSHP